jgi:uncharacterized spore protein YtfJ
MTLENVLKTLVTEIKTIASTETVIGKEIRAGDSIIVPVTKISFGVAGGGAAGEGHKEGAGAGGGVTIEPIAFIVVTNGRPVLLNLNEKPDSLNKVIDLVPGILDKITKRKKDGEAAEKADEKEKQ